MTTLLLGVGGASSHPGDDLEAGLLLLVDVQHRDDFAQQVGHFLRGALVLLLGPPESVVDVVGDFGEAPQRGDVGVLFELLPETKGWIASRGPGTDSDGSTDSTRVDWGTLTLTRPKLLSSRRFSKDWDRALFGLLLTNRQLSSSGDLRRSNNRTASVHQHLGSDSNED